MLTLAAWVPFSADAHGPTVRVAYSGVRPRVVSIEAGTTVHFQNANASGAVCTIVADDGSFESPPLSRAEGWHYTFDKPGSHAFHLKELAKSAGKIVVGPRPAH